MRRGEKMRGQVPSSTLLHGTKAWPSPWRLLHGTVAQRRATSVSATCRALPRTRWLPTATCSKPTMPSNPQQGTTRRAHRSCEQVLRGGVAEAS